jgi:hypothetical protein
MIMLALCWSHAATPFAILLLFSSLAPFPVAAFSNYVTDKDAVQGSKATTHLLLLVDNNKSEQIALGKLVLEAVDQELASKPNDYSDYIAVLVPCNGAGGDEVKNFLGVKTDALPYFTAVATNRGML